MQDTKPNIVKIEDLGVFVLSYLMKNQVEVNHFKLQKVLYYIQAWHLVYFDQNPMFIEEPEAWVNGPVYRTIFDKLKKYPAHVPLKIEDPQKLDDWFEGIKSKLDLKPEQWSFLEEAVRHFGFKSHEKLILDTHSEKPWNEARQGLSLFDYSSNPISHKSMYDYYFSKKKK